MDQLRPAGHRLDGRLHLGELVALGRIGLTDDSGDTADESLVDERVDAQGDPLLLHLLFDLPLVDLVGADVIDDLDPLALLDVVDHQLADHAVAERDVADDDRQVVEEVGRPEPFEVGEDDLLGLIGERHPFLLVRIADQILELDVVDVGQRVDHVRPALRGETGQQGVDVGAGIGRGRGARRRHLEVAHGGGELQGLLGRNVGPRDRGRWRRNLRRSRWHGDLARRSRGGSQRGQLALARRSRGRSKIAARRRRPRKNTQKSA